MNPRSRQLVAALLMSAWGGASLLTIAVVAPGAFRALPTRAMAGVMVGQVLPAVFVTGIVVGVVIALLVGIRGPGMGAATTALASAAACAVAQFGINPKIVRLRALSGGGVDNWSQDDPRRVMFGVLHGYSVGALAVAMLAGAVALAFLLYAIRSDRPTASPQA